MSDLPQPGRPAVCLLDHRHSPACAPIPRGESEAVYDYGIPRSAPCGACLHPKRKHRRPWLALLLRRPLCRGLVLGEMTGTCHPVAPCGCTGWRANP